MIPYSKADVVLKNKNMVKALGVLECFMGKFYRADDINDFKSQRRNLESRVSALPGFKGKRLVTVSFSNLGLRKIGENMGRLYDHSGYLDVILSTGLKVDPEILDAKVGLVKYLDSAHILYLPLEDVSYYINFDFSI